MEQSYSLPNYPLRVSYLAGVADGEIFFNHGLEHAKVVLQELFKKAKTNIVLVTGSLCGEMYNKKMFDETVRKNISINIIYTDEEPQGKIFRYICELSKIHSSLITIKKVDESKKNIVHYCLIDNQHYRMEADVENSIALCAFGAHRVGKKDTSNKILSLLSSFSDLFSPHEKEIA